MERVNALLYQLTGQIEHSVYTRAVGSSNLSAPTELLRQVSAKCLTCRDAISVRL